MNAKNYTMFAISIFVVVISIVYRLNIVMNLTVILLFVAIYLVISEIFRRQEEKIFLENQLLIAKEMVLDNNNYAIMIVRDKKVLWANDYSYDEFPALLNKRDIELINLDKLDVDSKFTYQNKTYHCSISHNVYQIQNVTKEERELKVLQENKANIGFLQFDNYENVKQLLNDSEFIEYERAIRSNLLKFFEEKSIQYVQMSASKFQLIFPTSVIIEMQNDKFEIFNKLTEVEEKKANLHITISLGLAINFPSVRETAIRAEDALELATNRGGAQIVVFDQDEREFYGGKVNVVRGSIKLKARLMGNTLLNILSKRDVVYLMTHKYPDSDGLAAVTLMKEFILANTNADAKILIDENIDPQLKEHLDVVLDDTGYYVDVVVDHTKRNILIILDTQSHKLLSNPRLIEEVEEVVVIDHHQTPLDYIDSTLFNWIEPNGSSTTELIAEILNVSNVELKSEYIANFALLGLVTDTNNFNFRTTASTLEVVASLVNHGGSIDKARAMQRIDFDQMLKINELMYKSYIMNDFTVMRTQQESDDVILSICANNLLEVKGMVGSIVISEIKDNVNKVKIRTDGSVNARQLIEEFGGGGHMSQSAGVLSDEQVHHLLIKIQELKE